VKDSPEEIWTRRSNERKEQMNRAINLGAFAIFSASMASSEPVDHQQYTCAQVRDFAVGKSRAELEKYAVIYQITDKQRRFVVACLHARHQLRRLD